MPIYDIISKSTGKTVRINAKTPKTNDELKNIADAQIRERAEQQVSEGEQEYTQATDKLNQLDPKNIGRQFVAGLGTGTVGAVPTPDEISRSGMLRGTPLGMTADILAKGTDPILQESLQKIEDDKAQGITQKVARGAGHILPTLAMMKGLGLKAPSAEAVTGITSKIANPFLQNIATKAGLFARGGVPLASWSGGQEAIKGEGDMGEVAKKAILGGLTGKAFSLAGQAGANIPLIPSKVGSTLASAGVGYALGGEDVEDKAASAILAGGLNLMNPPERTKFKNPDKILQKATDIYRKVVKATANEQNKIEKYSGKSIDEYYRFMAEEGLPIHKTGDNRLDTRAAREIIKTKIDQKDNELMSAIRSNPKKQIRFDLREWAGKAKANMDELFPNAREAQVAKKDVESFLKAEQDKYGSRYLTGEQAQTAKRGLWKVAFDTGNPNAKKIAKRIGFLIKEDIEKAYIDSADIKGLNDNLGKLITVEGMLDKANNRVVAGGKMGQYVARIGGGIAGAKLGPLGPIIGQQVGKMANIFATSPERLTKKATKMAK